MNTSQRKDSTNLKTIEFEKINFIIETNYKPDGKALQEILLNLMQKNWHNSNYNSSK